jgi:anti-sigma28 factor (negative regulator of flagellin synthesis)
MSIDRVNISNAGIDRSQSSQPAESARSAEKDRAAFGGSDSIALSVHASDLNRLSKSVEESHAQRLERVRAQLQAGDYQTATADIAQRLIDFNLR